MRMNRESKAETIQDLARRLGEASAVFLADFTGLDVKTLSDLRRQLRGADAEFLVVKNTLARRALQGGPWEGLGPYLEGPTAFALGRGDAARGAKVLIEFARRRERPQLKIGMVGDAFLSPEQVRRLAQLPPREVLLAQLLGGLRSPLAGMVFLLRGLLQQFVGTLEAIRAQRQGA